MKNSRVKKKIVELTKSCIVCASAGTGKTYTLVERYLEVLKLGLAGPGEIIAITFTEEAAKEMKERIAKEVNLWDANPVLKEKIIYGLGNAYISTVHSFCNRIIQENMDEIEIPYDYRIMDEAEENVMRDRFISQYLNNHLLRKSQIITYLLRFYSVASLRSMLNHAWENYFLLRQTLEKA
ncbi:MAG: UvrD-helicase domain-containing protein, partial [Candidatus Marinimicrobia bacterium]|nr:UvrD-helicase domain-containing protein [Candidatus Neomarinimicrobiota bacterium]